MQNFTIKITLLLLLILSNFSLGKISYDSTGTGKLTIVIKGFESDEGNCRFALDNSKQVFERDDSVWIGKVLPINNKEVTVTIDSLLFGVYAVRVFHDKNINEKLDTNILGIPTEDYGYSNDASGWFGPPSWENAKFIFNKPEMKINIHLD